VIGYVTLGTSDLDRAAAFYDEVFAVIGAKRLYKTDRLIAWGTGMGKPAVCATLPYDEQAPSVGNGVMVALQVDNAEQVDAVHAKAVELGAACEGPPGPRGTSGFYGAYFRDLDGNKLNAFHFGA
jgi:catechol 2,3-dioxygenase-like lactoylglutathione lyase family enzyme